MWHTILISAHAVTATAALTAGVIAVPRARMFGVYLGALVAMEVFLVLAIAVEWGSTTPRPGLSSPRSPDLAPSWRGVACVRDGCDHEMTSA